MDCNKKLLLTRLAPRPTTDELGDPGSLSRKSQPSSPASWFVPALVFLFDVWLLLPLLAIGGQALRGVDGKPEVDAISSNMAWCQALLFDDFQLSVPIRIECRYCH